MPHSTATQIRVQAVRALIKSGLSNAEIMAELPQYDLHPEMVRAHRRKLGIVQPEPERISRQQGRIGVRLGHRCPKCRGAILRGGVRMGLPAADIETCVNCGLTNESGSYYDAHHQVRVEL